MPKAVRALPTPLAQQYLSHELLGEYIRARRTQLDLTIEDAAAFCGVTKDTLMSLEHGNGRVQLGSALKICKELGVKLKVLSWEDEDNKDVWV